MPATMPVSLCCNNFDDIDAVILRDLTVREVFRLHLHGCAKHRAQIEASPSYGELFFGKHNDAHTLYDTLRVHEELTEILRKHLPKRVVERVLTTNPLRMGIPLAPIPAFVSSKELDMSILNQPTWQWHVRGADVVPQNKLLCEQLGTDIKAFLLRFLNKAGNRGMRLDWNCRLLRRTVGALEFVEVWDTCCMELLVTAVELLRFGGKLEGIIKEMV